MPKPSTGAWTVYESLRIELSYLLRKGWIKKNCRVSFQLTWTNQQGEASGNIYCNSSYLGSPVANYLELMYSIKKSNGEKLERCYKIYLYEQESNLGKGKHLYFLCPQSGRKCRILYSAYGSEFFKSRESYTYRLYYDGQISSNLWKYNDYYWRIDKHLNKIKKITRHGQRTYKGLLTRNSVRYNRLFWKQCKMDELRWNVGMPKKLRGMMF